MNCRKVRERLSDTIDGSLKGPVNDAVASHLGACEGCREEHRRLLTTRRLLSTYGTIPAPRDFTHLATRLAIATRRSEVLLRLRRGLVMTTAAAASVVVLWQWPRAAPPPSGPIPPRVAVRDVAEVEELHQAFAVQQSLDARDGLLLFAPRWAERAR